MIPSNTSGRQGVENGKAFPFVCLRHALAGRTWCFIPVTQLERSAEQVVLRIGCGTEWLAACDAQGRRLRLGEADVWQLSRVRWTGRDLNYLIPRHAWLAFGLLSESGNRRGQTAYVNFQRPLQETAWGFDTLDLELDLIGERRTSPGIEWAWKDQERFEKLAASGFLSREDVVHVQHSKLTAKAAYAAVVEQLEDWAALSLPPPSLDFMLSASGLPDDLASFLPDVGG